MVTFHERYWGTLHKERNQVALFTWMIEFLKLKQ